LAADGQGWPGVIILSWPRADEWRASRCRRAARGHRRRRVRAARHIHARGALNRPITAVAVAIVALRTNLNGSKGVDHASAPGRRTRPDSGTARGVTRQVSGPGTAIDGPRNPPRRAHMPRRRANDQLLP